MSKTPRTILIIDDSPDDLEFYAQLLKRASGDFSYTVLTAESAGEGLQTFMAHVVDCTFIDFNMPEDDGLAVVEMLQKQTGGKQIPMVILTGEPHQRIQAEAARQGALDYIIKDSVNSFEALEKIITKVISWADAINSGKSVSNGD